ncbi:MAG: enoyl-CoA hydratase/isomerase family protein [Desulfobacterales bacterium]|jgi:enoyl-CoA hydratase
MSKQFTRLMVEYRDAIAWVTINRPGDRNSIDTPLMMELDRVLTEIEKTATRAVVFSGAGDAYFIGGADGIEMMQCLPEAARDFSVRIQKLFDRMEASPLILVAAINGLCFGGGFEFAMACDLRVAGETARIGLPEVKVGIIPGGGGTQRLPRLVGVGRAMEMILSGKLYPGKEAYTRGLVQHVVAPERLFSEVGAILQTILRNPQHALTQAKRAVRAAQNRSPAEGFEIESDAFSRCFQHNYFVELMRRQLREGTLKTTAKLPDGLYEQGKESV